MSVKLLHGFYLSTKPMLNNFSCTKMTKIDSRLLKISPISTKDESKRHTTVDADDVEKHSRLMAEWWNPNGPLKALHSMNLLRVPFIRDGMVSYSNEEKSLTPLKGKKILDVGCGGGILSEPLAKLGADVTGIDASQQLIELAKEHASINPKLKDNKPMYINVSIEEHAVNNSNVYDCIVASEIIEHVNDKELFIKSCISSLKPRGRIFFTTPNRTQISRVAGIWMAEYVLNLLPKGTHDYQKFTTPNELTFLLERNNCHVEAVYGMFYNFLTKKWQWIKSPSLMFALQAVKLN